MRLIRGIVVYDEHIPADGRRQDASRNTLEGDPQIPAPVMGAQNDSDLHAIPANGTIVPIVLLGIATAIN
jgi:hypothetical protein